VSAPWVRPSAGAPVNRDGVGGRHAQLAVVASVSDNDEIGRVRTGERKNETSGVTS
jgi:hypothetical protein